MRKGFRRSSSMLSGSNSSSSSLTNDDVSSEEKIKSRTVSFFSATARYRQMKFKIVRKIRSKVIWTSLCSGNRNGNAAAAAKVSPGCNSGETSSCLSSNLNGKSSARSLRYAKRDNRSVRTVDDHAAVKSGVGSPHLRRRAEAILKLLSMAGGSSELKIRQMLGDSPDTSKALRMFDLSFFFSLSSLTCLM
ncbi:hypothetical protein TanjilG_16812 [Lupinus angustifolius]|uniref:HTH three-helical bundle domain-containing protein n=1 Tax=Lupinus angustifolius TaxID=3871 RepID=A0A1J7H0L8_LUPAN|nr:hypothetical protein TanjilG_16812 [Lupinus angustifolius]